MRTLLSPHLESNLLVKFPSISFAKGKPIFILHCRGLLNPRNTISSSFRASYTANSSTSYNGWDDLRIWVDSDELGESNLLKKILISLGINDRKYVVTCILGFVCALAISRVKVSSIIVFPAAAIVFAVGYWFGFVNGKPHKGLSLNGSKRRVKDDSFRFYDDKLKTLLEIFDGFDIKNGDLKNNIKKAIEDERVDFDDLETYMNTVETLEGLILNARNMVEDFIGDSSVERKEVEKKPYQNSRKKKDTGDKGFEVLGFLGNFLKDNPVDSNSSSKNFMRNILAKDVDDRDLENLQSAEVESDPIPNEDSSRSKATLTDGSRFYRKSKYNGGDNERKRILSGRKSNRMEAYMNTENFLKADEYNYQNLRFSSDERVRLNVSAHRKIRKWAFDDSLSSNTEFDISNESLLNGPSLKSQQLSENSNGAYMSSEGKENVGFKSFGASIREERMTVEDELYTRKYQSQSENGLGSFSSSTVSDDMLFDTYVRNANELLKQAKECLKARNDETFAEEKLQKSAELLCKAITLKPLSLPAIGQLGNTYLLHGELKLKISRELRNLLSESDDFGVERSNLYFLEDTVPSKGGLENLLSSACEECEALLVEAGRKYRMALSIDRNDVKALYNWGLALSFRAQLIADVGPDAALDADKLFLAAIDKFNAMMSRNNDYAPEALFRWGMALQQRSRLRPSNSRDKVKLLQQAKRLYEDAVNMGLNNLQVRKALSSCISELNFTDI